MKRAAGLLILFIVCATGFMTAKGALPFTPIFGNSMAPTLQSGSLLTIKPVNPDHIKVGDIIIYNVPANVRDYYNYPPVVSHRVIEIKIMPSLGFRTRGDNTGEDPFTIRPLDIRGTLGRQIPFLGLPLFVFQSRLGLIFVITAVVLLTIFLYGSEIMRVGARIHRGILAPVINEEKRTNRVLTHKIEATEKKMDNTEQALDKFSAAITEYAQHLASHTSAVRSLAEASHELKKGAAAQNRVLMSLVQNIGQTAMKQETAPPGIKPPTVDEIKLPHRPQEAAEETVQPFHRALNRPVPPGCARKQPEPPAKEVPAARKELPNVFDRFQNKQELTKEALAAEKEIFSALDRLNSKLDKFKDQA